MIELITGTPGAGKTLHAVEKISAWLKEGRTVFTNINGITLPGDLRHFEAALDWTDTPDGSVVVYDEAQQHFGADGGRGRSERKDIAGLETHRHTGHTIVFITQHPRLLHAHVIRLVGRHSHVARMFGTNNTYIYWLDRAMNIDSRADLKFAQSDTWRYPKELMGAYKSASMHIKTRRIPMRVWFYVVFLVLLLLVGGFSLWKVTHSPQISMLMGKQVDETNKAGEKLVSPQKLAEKAPVLPADQQKVDFPVQDWAGPRQTATPVAGCIAFHDPKRPRCSCYSKDMTPIVMPTSECLSRIREPLPRTLISDTGSQSKLAQRSEHGVSGSPVSSSVPQTGAATSGGMPEIADRPWPSVGGYQGAAVTVVPDTEYASRPWRNQQ
ncbi:zonular occludens toxin domain-containing protein [Pseudomonas knackmussii]|uniref:zonular occludens toxin domain-containing protein n=1 Tax=Pseudomonas knackmussii TaxID=65741 RepID=UPI003BE040DF